MNKDDVNGVTPDEPNRSVLLGKHMAGPTASTFSASGLHDEQDANESMQPPASFPAKRRGRPSKGSSVPMRLSDEERLVADLLGDGVAAEGVRLALRVVSRLGIDAARLLAVDAPTARPMKLSARAAAALEANPALAKTMLTATQGADLGHAPAHATELAGLTEITMAPSGSGFAVLRRTTDRPVAQAARPVEAVADPISYPAPADRGLEASSPKDSA